jgi:hypothetical protein
VEEWPQCSDLRGVRTGRATAGPRRAAAQAGRAERPDRSVQHRRAATKHQHYRQYLRRQWDGAWELPFHLHTRLETKLSGITTR